MDSQNPPFYEQSAPGHVHEDARHTSSPALQQAPAPSEAGSYQAPRFSGGSAATAASPAAESSRGSALPPIPDIPLDEGPVTVPVLGAQPITKRWEQILDDEDSQGAPTTWVQDEPGTGPGSMYDYDELELDVARGVAGKPYPREDAFAFRERNWDGWKRSRKSVVVLLSLVMMFTVATIGALLAGAYIQQATRHISIAAPVPTTGNFSGGLVIQPARETPVPTPEAPKYQIGVWMSNNAPSGGVVKVFVRVSQDVKPIARIPVKLAVQIPGATLHYGPTKTDSYGLATFNVRFGGVAGSPCFVTASAKIGKSEYTADTVFVPI